MVERRIDWLPGAAADDTAKHQLDSEAVECIDLERRFPNHAVGYEDPYFIQTQDPWYKIIKCRWGHISPAGGSKLWACTKSRGVIVKKLLAAGGVMRMDGDDGCNIVFDVANWKVFFELMGAK